jgi:hypothetical protein
LEAAVNVTLICFQLPVAVVLAVNDKSAPPTPDILSPDELKTELPDQAIQLLFTSKSAISQTTPLAAIVPLV